MQCTHRTGETRWKTSASPISNLAPRVDRSNLPSPSPDLDRVCESRVQMTDTRDLLLLVRLRRKRDLYDLARNLKNAGNRAGNLGWIF